MSASWVGVGERVGDVRGRVGRGERDLVAAVHERERDSGREGRLADPAFAHCHHDAVAGCVKLIDELVKPGKVNRDRLRGACHPAIVCPGELAQSIESGDVAGDEPHAGGRKVREARGRARERCRLTVGERDRGRVILMA